MSQYNLKNPSWPINSASNSVLQVFYGLYVGGLINYSETALNNILLIRLKKTWNLFKL